MKLNTVLNYLEKMNFIDDDTKIQIVINRGKSIMINDKLFDCYIPVQQARHFFGELDVSLNQIRKLDDSMPCVFWFLLAYEERSQDNEHDSFCI